MRIWRNAFVLFALSACLLAGCGGDQRKGTADNGKSGGAASKTGVDSGKDGGVAAEEKAQVTGEIIIEGVKHGRTHFESSEAWVQCRLHKC